MKFKFWIWCLLVCTGQQKSKRRFFLRRVALHFGNGIFHVARIVMAIIDALRKLFEKENEDDSEHNGET